MCGIAGLLYFDRERRVDPRVLDRMTDVQAHRGPDGRGTHVDGALGLGHRRLAIIDLSEGGAQPMPNEDGSVWVVLNGEIYNYRELREELEAKGHRFRSRTDTEVLVHLYEEMGAGLVERLRGMFAFALWDARARRLVLARDRFGQKPLVYRLTRDGVHFASELKGILADPEVPRVPDPLALHSYLTYGYVPAPATAFEGVAKLPPGHVLEVVADGGSALRRYWRLSLAPKRRGAGGGAEADRAAEEVLGLLDEAVRLRLVADVPLGAFLSGGVDSSAIVASMCAVSGRSADTIRTFAIGFDEPAYDESGEASRVARHLGTDHTSLVLTPDAFAGLEDVAWHYGEPFADGSAFPTFAVSKLAREHVTVALSGDGGDELFCGYTRYVGTRLEERLRALPSFVRAVPRNRYLIELARRVGLASNSVSGGLAHARLCGDLSEAELYVTRLELVTRALKEDLYAPGLAEPTRGIDARDVVGRAIAASDGETLTERCAHADVTTYLPDDILTKVDVASMAYGLECRSPFMDHRLAEYVGRLPFRFKMRRFQTKLALKRAVRRRLPPETLARAKQGFGVPLQHWFRGDLDPLLNDVLLSERFRARGWFREDAVRRLIAEHSLGRHDHQNALYSLLMLETWARLWVDPPPGTVLGPRSALPDAASAAAP